MKLRYIISLAIALCLASCVNEENWLETDEVNGIRYSTFDFRSTFDCDLTLSLGQREFVYIYTEDPAANPNAEAIRTLRTDDDGNYECRLILPTALIGKQIYAYTSDGLICADVTPAGATFSQKGAAKSRFFDSALQPSTDLCVNIKNDYLGKMPRPDKENLKKLVETGDIAVHTKTDNTMVLFTYLHSFGWNSNYIYYYYYKGEDPITLENRDQYIAKICNDDRFLCTRGWGIKVKSRPNNNPDNDVVEILTTSGLGGINLRFCDISRNAGDGVIEGDWTPYGNSMIGISNPLYYYGDIDLESDDYEEGMPFPKGYKIGLILKSVDSDIRASLTDPNYEIPANKVNYFFSNPKLNVPDKYSGNQVHVGRFWSSDEANDISRFVYGFEDSIRNEDWVAKGADYNFTDFLCMISTNPAAYTTDVASLSSTYASVSGTLLFEDLFPRQGDYDMNDVMVEYRKVMEFEKRPDANTNKDYIRNFYIEITPVHHGATYDDYVYINFTPRYNDRNWGLLPGPQLIDFRSTYGCSLKEAANYNEYQILTGSPRNLKTVKLYLIQDWVPYGQPSRNLALTDADLSFDDIDAFLWVKDTNREVHITGYACAGVNGSSNDDLDENLQSYKAPQADDGSFMPWAIDIPIKSDLHGYRGFIPVTEKVKITDEYLSFYDWFNGEKSKAWYENKYHRPVK